jgi:aerobic carbon-monoxide dehydrogenase medium subunit
MLRPFTVHQPSSHAEAVALRESHGEEAIPYAGGTELILAMKLGFGHWPHLIDVKRIPGLKAIDSRDGMIRIGAAATHRDIARNELVGQLLPALARLESHVANVRVRAAGTLGGNLAFAEPHADPPALLVALGARVVLVGVEGERCLNVADFLKGAYQTDLSATELMLAIEVPIPPQETRAVYLNFKVLERPSIGVAVVTKMQGRRISGEPIVVLGAVDEVPRRVPAESLVGAEHDDQAAIAAVAESARRSVDPVDDLAGTAEYKRHVTGVLVRRALAAVANGSSSR